MKTRTKTSVLVLTLAAFFAAVPLLIGSTGGIDASEPAGVDPPHPSSLVATSELAPALLRAGLSPEALAAAGVSAGAVDDVVLDFATAMAAEPTRLSSADADRAEARRERDRLQRLIRSGRGSSEDVTAYQAAVADFESADAARESCLTDFCHSGTAGLTNQQATLIDTIQQNRQWHFPVEFLTVNRSVTCPRNRYQSLCESWRTGQGVRSRCLEAQA